ncbi:MAG: P-II family nitrogen regulator [Proteobacteria bacterium]|nr:P-II family nitrogen regulator [Pseudomonadota bacterium]MBU1710271.1 P-II family nitrogen regulator [Pseudomonadota bacterium]
MKRIIALIRPVMRDDVIAALHLVEDFPGAVMTEIQGIRRGTHQKIKEKNELLTIGFRTYIRIEIICTDSQVPILFEAIRANAHTGKPGDGKIFVSSMESALRISNGQTDEEAL